MRRQSRQHVKTYERRHRAHDRTREGDGPHAEGTHAALVAIDIEGAELFHVTAEQHASSGVAHVLIETRRDCIGERGRRNQGEMVR
jgi:hypothetical protein